MDVEKIRKDFPILEKKINGKTIVYFDNAATSQKPKQVVEKIVEYYYNYNSGVKRGVSKLVEEATEEFENSRKKIMEFINAEKNSEIILTKNATESLNLTADSWAENNIKQGDKIVISIAEHHANLVTWQQLAKRKNAELIYIETDENGELIDFENKINNAKILALNHVSNVTGVVNDLEKICKKAKQEGAVTIIDGTQSAPHLPVDMKKIDCDFFAFTGHKMLGPTGIGVLYAKNERILEMDPVVFGGDMISEVKKYESKWNDSPQRFEAGTPNTAGTIGLGAAIDYLNDAGIQNVKDHEDKLTKYAMEKMNEIEKLEMVGPKEFTKNKLGIISFNIKGVHPHDVATLLNDLEGVIIRSGMHCAEPVHDHYKIDSSARASFYLYNTEYEIDRFIDALKKIKTIFK